MPVADDGAEAQRSHRPLALTAGDREGRDGGDRVRALAVVVNGRWLQPLEAILEHLIVHNTGSDVPEAIAGTGFAAIAGKHIAA